MTLVALALFVLLLCDDSSPRLLHSMAATNVCSSSQRKCCSLQDSSSSRQKRQAQAKSCLQPIKVMPGASRLKFFQAERRSSKHSWLNEPASSAGALRAHHSHMYTPACGNGAQHSNGLCRPNQRGKQKTQAIWANRAAASRWQQGHTTKRLEAFVQQNLKALSQVSSHVPTHCACTS